MLGTPKHRTNAGCTVLYAAPDFATVFIETDAMQGEHGMQVARVATIVGVEEARRLSAIDPVQADLAQGATLAGAMALAVVSQIV